MRGLTRSMMRLIIPPLPAASRPSKMITMRASVVLTQSWSLTSSTCSLKISASYSFLPIFDWPSTPELCVLPSSPDFCFFFFLDFWLIVLSGLLGVGRLLRGRPVLLRLKYERVTQCWRSRVFIRQYVGH